MGEMKGAARAFIAAAAIATLFSFGQKKPDAKSLFMQFKDTKSLQVQQDSTTAKDSSTISQENAAYRFIKPMFGKKTVWIVFEKTLEGGSSYDTLNYPLSPQLQEAGLPDGLPDVGLIRAASIVRGDGEWTLVVWPLASKKSIVLVGSGKELLGKYTSTAYESPWGDHIFIANNCLFAVSESRREAYDLAPYGNFTNDAQLSWHKNIKSPSGALIQGFGIKDPSWSKEAVYGEDGQLYDR